MTPLPLLSLWHDTALQTLLLVKSHACLPPLGSWAVRDAPQCRRTATDLLRRPLFHHQPPKPPAVSHQAGHEMACERVSSATDTIRHDSRVFHATPWTVSAGHRVWIMPDVFSSY